MSGDKPQNAEEKEQIGFPNSLKQPESTGEPQRKHEESRSGRALQIHPIRISIMLLTLGTLSLVFSVLSNSQVLAFIGLGLTFWGALFLLVRPSRYVEDTLLNLTSIPSYITIDRAIRDLKVKGNAYYIPPYPEQTYVPEHLKGLKEMVAFISTTSGATVPSLEEIAKGKFLLDNPKGICLSPPGLGILTRIEEQLRLPIAKINLTELCESLSQIIPENLLLAKEVEMKPTENQVYVKIIDSTYKQLYEEKKLKSVHILGCPLTSAIACAIAKSTARIVTIPADRISEDAETIEVWLQIMQG